MDTVLVDLRSRIPDKKPSPSKLSANLSSMTQEMKDRTPISIGQSPKGDFGPSAVLHVPIFAEAYNLLMNPELVQLEEGKTPGSYDIFQTAALMKNAVNEDAKNEREFNTGLMMPLQRLFDPVPIELHYSVMLGKAIVTQPDWVGFSHTPHGMVGVPIIGDGKKDKPANATVQSFWSLQHLTAVDEVLVSLVTAHTYLMNFHSE